VHTLGSLPAIPLAAYMFTRHARIVPRSTPGAFYFISMLIGTATVFLVTHQSVSYGIGAATQLGSARAESFALPSYTTPGDTTGGRAPPLF